MKQLVQNSFQILPPFVDIGLPQKLIIQIHVHQIVEYFLVESPVLLIRLQKHRHQHLPVALVQSPYDLIHHTLLICQNYLSELFLERVPGSQQKLEESRIITLDRVVSIDAVALEEIDDDLVAGQEGARDALVAAGESVACNISPLTLLHQFFRVLEGFLFECKLIKFLDHMGHREVGY